MSRLLAVVVRSRSVVGPLCRFHQNIQNIAGHCCHGWHHVSNIKGTIGQHNRGEHDDGEFTVFMKSKHKHSGYRQSTLENDICILKTKRKKFSTKTLIFTKNVIFTKM